MSSPLQAKSKFPSFKAKYDYPPFLQFLTYSIIAILKKIDTGYNLKSFPHLCTETQDSIPSITEV